jgi:methyl coenzyme M reductase alpha subunit
MSTTIAIDKFIATAAVAFVAQRFGGSKAASVFAAIAGMGSALISDRNRYDRSIRSEA